MSFEKAQQLLELATFVAARRLGVTLNDVGERFGISRRTAQRIMHALEAHFPDTESAFDEDGHKRWRLQTGALRDLLTLTSDGRPWIYQSRPLNAAPWVSKLQSSADFAKRSWLLCRAAKSPASRLTTRHYLKLRVLPRGPTPPHASRQRSLRRFR